VSAATDNLDCLAAWCAHVASLGREGCARLRSLALRLQISALSRDETMGDATAAALAYSLARGAEQQGHVRLTVSEDCQVVGTVPR
jgi:hypothetical protein